MLRVQLNVGERQSPSQQQQQQHLESRPPFQYNVAAAPFDSSDSATAAAGTRQRSNGQLKRSLQHSQPSQHSSGQAAEPSVRPSHSAKGRKVRGNSGAHASAMSSSTLPSATPSPSASSSSNSNSSSKSDSTHASISATNTPIAAGGGRKVLKQEVTQLQHIVDGMQQQVQAATREIQELRSMVGRMADANTQHKLAQLASQQLEQQYQCQQHQHQHQHQLEQSHHAQNQHTHGLHRQDQPQSPLVAPPQGELQALALLHAPLVDIYQYHHQSNASASTSHSSHSGGISGIAFAPPSLTDVQQNELVGHFAAASHTGNSISGGGSSGSGSGSDNDATVVCSTSDDALMSIDSLGFDCRMEQVLLCDDDDGYPLFFES